METARAASGPQPRGGQCPLALCKQWGPFFEAHGRRPATGDREVELVHTSGRFDLISYTTPWDAKIFRRVA